ncbi:MAG: hypothetical protein ACJ763_13130 [Bdellovibrionia bacterium]
MANAEKKFDDKLIGLEREAHDSGIVDPKKDELANRHSIPGQGDPSIRRIRPDQGSLITPPLSEQDDNFQDADERISDHADQDQAGTGEQPVAKGNTQLPEDKKRKKAA